MKLAEIDPYRWLTDGSFKLSDAMRLAEDGMSREQVLYGEKFRLGALGVNSGSRIKFLNQARSRVVSDL